MKKRWVSIDNLKGLLTLLVILGHVTVGLEGLANGAYSTATWVEKISTIIYAFHMPAFFALSGFFWKEKGKISAKSRCTIIKNKVIALALPYLLCSIAYFLIKYAMAGYTEVDMTWEKLLLIPVQPIEFFWFLYSLFTISILAEVLDALGIKKQIVLVVLMLIALGDFVDTDFMALYKTAENAVYFYIGSVAFDCKEYLTKSKGIVLTGIATLVFFWVYLNVYEADNVVFHFLLCVSLIGFLIGIAMRWMEREYGWLTYIGKYSMPFYVIHVIFVGGIRILLYRANVQDTLCHVIVGFTLSTLVCYVLYRFVMSKIKWMDFFFYPMNYIKK